MKIAIFMNPADQSQSGKYVRYLCNGLQAKGDDVYPIRNETEFNTGIWKTADTILIGTRHPNDVGWTELTANKKSIIYICSIDPMVKDIERYVISTSDANEAALRKCNGIWLKDTLKKHKSYLETLYSVPVTVIPTYWDPCFSENSSASSSSSSKYIEKDPGLPIDIVILEENDSFNTSCWKALVICEQLFLQNPERINQVFIFNAPETNKTSMDMINSLTLTQKGKIRIFKSLPIKDIIAFFLQSKNNIAFLSNQIFDDVNYGYYDAIHAGFPIVHSSPVLKEKGCENYYESNDILGAIGELNNLKKKREILKSVVHTPSVQIVVITVNAERKSIMEKQFAELKMSYSIHYMDGWTPETSKDYLSKDISIQEARNIYCSRSHYKAIQHASLGNPLDFTIVMEDDASIHKEKFIPLINELVEQWDVIMNPSTSKMVSLGWIPTNNYEYYSNIKTEHTLHSISDIKTLRHGYCVGLQAYMIKNDAAASVTSMLIHNSHSDYINCISSANITDINVKSLDVADHVLPRLLMTTMIFPPVVIEQPLPSFLFRNNEVNYWSKFFRERESMRNEYWIHLKKLSEITSASYNPTDLTIPLVVGYDNALDQHPNTNYFMNTLNKNEFEYCIVRISEHWKGLEDKIEAMMLKLQTLPDDKVVIISDTRDVLCCRNSKALMKGFASFRTDFLTCVEIFCDTTTEPVTKPRPYCVPLKNYWSYHNVNPWPLRRFVNGGLLIGKAKALREFYTWAYLRHEIDDQSALGIYMNEFPDRMKCDTEALLIHTSGFGKSCGLYNVKTQRQDSPTLAELFGRGCFFLHVHNHGFAGQKLIYDTVRQVLDLGACSAKLNILYGVTEEMCDWEENPCNGGPSLKPEDFE